MAVRKNWISTAACALICICVLVVSGSTCKEAGQIPNSGELSQRPASEDELRRGLERAANELLAIIEKGDPKEFPKICSGRGVVFGVDWPATSVAAIRNQISKKQGVYCSLFDTKCLRLEDEAARAKAGAAPRNEPLYSYRERLLKASAREVKIGFSGRLGDVSVLLSNDVQGEMPIEFQFVLEGGAWKLSAIPLY